uniref:Uncharacterized protein n=1 Tax=viral metagenome TaxID=1070528 RepID=A0A6H2A4D9_9ZZZZ
MATLAELRQCCEELGIESSALTREDMEGNIRTVFDKKYSNRKAPISADQFSEPLLKFLTKQHFWHILDRDGNELKYNYLKEG